MFLSQTMRFRIRGGATTVTQPAPPTDEVNRSATQDRVTLDDVTSTAVSRTEPTTRASRRAELTRLRARRHRLAARIRGVREPAQRGALRTAMLRLDATIVALCRTLDTAP